MQKIYLKDLKSKIFKRTALIPILNLSEILDLNGYLSGDEIMAEIFRKSLANFELYHPLILEMNVYFDTTAPTGRPGYFEFKSNFQAYLDGKLDEDQIILIPNSINGLRITGAYASAGNYFRCGDYDKPYIQLPMVASGRYIVRALCSRPLIESYTPDKFFDDNAAIYWMDYDGVIGKIFLDQVLVDLLEYIRNLKGNFNLPNFPVDMFSAVDIAYQQAKQELDQYYLQSNWMGDLIM
jgi:hypothetical protein